MRKPHSFALALLLAGVVFAPACQQMQTCRTCNLQPGTVVSYVDAESNLHEYTAGSDGCISFEADDCSKYQVVDYRTPPIAPEHGDV